MSDQTAVTKGSTDFELNSLPTGEKFSINKVFVVPYFNDDENVLPDVVDTARLDNFKEVNNPTISEPTCIDVLIEQVDNHLLKALNE